MKDFVKLFVLSMGLVLGTAVSLYSQDLPEKKISLAKDAAEISKMKLAPADMKVSDLSEEAKMLNSVAPSSAVDDGSTMGQGVQAQSKLPYHEHSKIVDNGDGTFSCTINDGTRYQDEKGSWQDIDVSIEKANNNGYKYANTTNKFKTYYSDSPADGIMMNYEGQNLVFGKNYNISFIDGQGNALAGQERTAANAKQDDFRTLSYKDFYRGIDYKMIQLGRGVETGFFVNNRSAVASGAKTVRVSQTVEMPDGAYIMADGQKQGKSFCASEFEIMIPGYESWITFQPVVVYDASVDMDYIMKRAEIRHIEDNVDKDGKPVENPMDKYSYKAQYNVEMQGRTLTVSFDIPAEWLLADNRAYPVFIDPTIMVYDGTATNAYVPVYGFYADAYLKCEYIIPASQLTDMSGGTISAMKFYLSSPASDSWGSANFQVFMKEVSGTTISDFSGTTGATMVYEGSLDGTQSEMDVLFTTNYLYNGGNLLIGFYNTVEGTYKSSSFYGVEVTDACVQGYSYSSLDAITATQRNFIPKTTFTYTARTIPPCGDCTSITFSDLGFSGTSTVVNGTQIAICTDISVVFNKESGSTAPTYYTNGTAIRAYGGNTFTVSTTGSDPITSITLSIASGGGSNAISANTGTYSNGVWTGSASSVTFTIGGTSNHRRIAGIEVCTTQSGGGATDCDTEDFSGSSKRFTMVKIFTPVIIPCQIRPESASLPLSHLRRIWHRTRFLYGRFLE